ncbi:MAG: CPBP family intramembrane metalloprotease [Nibricoccus sp.]
MPTTFLLLMLAVLLLWFGGNSTASFVRRYAWFGMWSASLVVAITTKVLDPVGLVAVLVFGGATYAFAHAHRRWQIALAAVILVALAVGFMLHRVPGFHNPRVIDAARFTPDARPFTLYLNYDKTLIGLFLLGFCCTRIARWTDSKKMLPTTLPWAAVTIGLLMGISLAIGYVRFAPKLPPETWLWAAVNLLFVCTAEEAFFRGFIQAQLQYLWSGIRGGSFIALLVAAALFGLAHFPGGWAYVGLASVAGLGYGWIYQRTQRIEASILSHFALNTVHFLLFTYPALAVAN